MHARCEVQTCVSHVDPERHPERNLNDTLNDTLCVAWKARARPTFQPAFPANGWLHISGIAANSTSKPAAISHAHDRFCKRPLKKQTPNQNQPFPMLRSILQAAAQETHQWHRSKHQIKTSHSPCRRSILQAAAQETHQWHRTKHQIKTSHSPCRHSILQAGTQETTSDLSGIAAKSKSKPAILVYKHVRRSRLTRFSRIPNCTLDLGRLRAWTLQETNTADHHLGSLFPHVHTETQRPHNKASPEGLAPPRTKRNDLSNWE